MPIAALVRALFCADAVKLVKLMEEPRLQSLPLADTASQTPAKRLRVQGARLAPLFEFRRQQAGRVRAHVKEQGKSWKEARDVLHVVCPQSLQVTLHIPCFLCNIWRLHEEQEPSSHAAAICQRLSALHEVWFPFQTLEQDDQIVLLARYDFLQLRQGCAAAQRFIEKGHVIDLGSYRKKRLLQDADQFRSRIREPDEEDVLTACFLLCQNTIFP